MSNTPRASRPRASDKPAPVALNLDTYKFEVDAVPLFDFVMQGKRYVLRSPWDFGLAELDSLEVADRDPRLLLKALLSEDEYAALLASNPDMRQIRVIVNTYYEHYGYTPEAAGNSVASRTS